MHLKSLPWLLSMAVLAGCGGSGGAGDVTSGQTSNSTGTVTTPVNTPATTGGTQTTPASTTTTNQQSASTGIPKGSLAAMEARGVLPKLDRSTDLKGPDADNNGIRDDIDALLAARRFDQPKLTAAQQIARAYQAALLVNTADTQAVKAVQRKANDAMNCLVTRFGVSFAQLSSELENYTVNTRPRLTAYAAYNKALDGTVVSIPEGDTCE